LFLIPPGVAFFVHEKYALNPRATLAFTALMAAIWVFLVVVFYFAGRKQDTKA
jgi:hypothetical protein